LGLAHAAALCQSTEEPPSLQDSGDLAWIWVLVAVWIFIIGLVVAFAKSIMAYEARQLVRARFPPAHAMLLVIPSFAGVAQEREILADPGEMVIKTSVGDTTVRRHREMRQVYE
jgi:hypothetical protein